MTDDTKNPGGWPGAPGVPGNPWAGHPSDDKIEMLARIIDPEAFGLPSWVPSCGADYLTDRDEARDKAAAVLRFITPAEVAAREAAAKAKGMREAAGIAKGLAEKYHDAGRRWHEQYHCEAAADAVAAAILAAIEKEPTT